MDHSNVSFIRTNERILKKVKTYNQRVKRNKCLKIFLCYGLIIIICANMILLTYIILFPRKLSNNKGVKLYQNTLRFISYDDICPFLEGCYIGNFVYLQIFIILK